MNAAIPSQPIPERQPVLEARDLTKVYGGGLIGQRKPPALDHFNLKVFADRPTVTTIAGESGSGKTTLANLVLGFIEPSSGAILYEGQDVARMDRAGFLRYRREVQAVFQDPYEVYNPFYRVDHVFDMIISRFKLAGSAAERRALAEDALKVVGLNPDDILGKYPHELSGGQRQRIMVGRAFLLKPRLIVADEPVSMVDASLRGMILEIMLNLKREHGISILYITHDLSTAYQVSDNIYILYRGGVAEAGSIERVIRTPKHPYTQMLISSIPLPDPRRKWDTQVRLPEDENGGAALTPGCRFYDRCPHAWSRCREHVPPLVQIEADQQAACFLYGDNR